MNGTRKGDDDYDWPDSDGPAPSEAASPSHPAAAGRGPKQEGTTFATLPQFEAAALMPETSSRLLESLRSQIAQLTLELAGSGIRHEGGRYVVLPKTLRSAWMAKVRHPLLGELGFLVGQTRSTWVLLYDAPHEKIYEDPRFLGIELKMRDVTRTPKGKRMYVSRIERADLDLLNGIAAQDAGNRARSDSLAPTEGAFSYGQTMARLKNCSLVHCTRPDFSPGAFFASVHFMTPTQSDAGDYYYIEAGDPDAPQTCALHVGRDPMLPEGTFGHKATLIWHRERCFLYIDVTP